jgi:glycosyltransferase involved in cell wall biosynthesis
MSGKKIHLFYDLSTFRPEKRTGIGVYMHQLLKKMPQENIEITPLLKLSHWLRTKDVNISIYPQKVEIFKPWRLHVPENSIYHGPDFRLSLWAPHLPRVITIHDMLVFEEKFSDPLFDQIGQRDIARIFNQQKPTAVIANSHFTKEQIIKHFPHYKDKVYVTHLGCDRLDEQAASPIASHLQLPEKYFFFLGSLELRKNLLGIIQSYEIFRRQGGQEKLILCGFWGYGQHQIQKAIDNSAYRKDIILLQKVSDSECVKLFKNATAFFFPSLYEGFGIPILEAMKLSCPVVTSREGALAEVSGTAALQGNPHDAEDLALQLMEISRSPDLRNSLVQKGLERVKEFTWAQCAEQTLNVYKTVLGKS